MPSAPIIGVEVIAAPDLLALIAHFKGAAPLVPPLPGLADPPVARADLRQVKGQETAKRALEIAAAGGHNLLMSGPPGAGKSLMAACLPGILPELFSALKIALGTSIAVLFFAESFASMSGLGWLITDAWSRVDYLSMNAAIVALALVGLGLLALVDGLTAWVCPWVKA